MDSHPELTKLLTPRQTRYCPHQPTPKQQAFLWLPHLEAFYGGAAGGGKSDALLMAALQYADVPGYAALILRRTFAELIKPGALMDRAQEWLANTDAAWSEKAKAWHFPSGASLSFGYLEHDGDRFQYQSAAYQYVGFDELTEFSEIQYTYLFSRLRRLEGVAVPLRMRAASNPGGIGHEWVKERFIAAGREAGRIFIPALLEDNPHLDQVEYRRSLAKLDPVTRAQLQHGDWDIQVSGNLFKREWFAIVDAAPAQLKRVRYWDVAATEKKNGNSPDWTVGVLLASDGHGSYYVLDVIRLQERPHQVEQIVRQTADLDGHEIEVWMEEEPGSSGKGIIDHYRRNVLAGFTFRGDKVTGSKVSRAGPLSAAAEAGNVKLLRAAWNRDFLTELCLFPQAKVHDDQVDAASGAFGKLHWLRTQGVAAMRTAIGR